MTLQGLQQTKSWQSSDGDVTYIFRVVNWVRWRINEGYAIEQHLASGRASLAIRVLYV